MAESLKINPGILGRYYAASHVSGNYLSFAISGSYSLKLPATENSTEHLKLLYSWALQKTIRRHTTLCYGVSDKTPTEEAHFIKLAAVQLDDVAEFHLNEKSKGEKQGRGLAQMLEVAHEHVFTHQHQRPAWKTFVLIHSATEFGSSILDIAFICHHSIGDGTSGTAFHKTLLANLDLAVTLPEGLGAEWPYVVPSSIPPPIFVESVCKFPIITESSTPTSNPTTSESFPATPPYTFQPPLTPPGQTRILILALPPTIMPQLLAYCRSQNITVTALLHSLLVTYLSHTIPSAETFSAITPYSLRNFTGISRDEIVNHISAITTHWEPSIISLARTSTDNSPEESNVIARIAEQYKSAITTELAVIPENGSPMLNSVARIKDIHAYSKAAAERGMREYTYELSNVGSVDVLVPKSGKVVLEKMVFTQCRCGPAFCCSVISVKGGALTVGLSWEEGVVKLGVMVGLKEFLGKRLCSVGGVRDD